MSMLIVHELYDARDRILLLKQVLNGAIPRELPAYRNTLQEHLRQLEDALANAKIPEYYRVAVVGRFKVGKSSFVNKLAGARLAGVNTNPETAAISLFRYSDDTRAEVEFISAEEWEYLKGEFAEDPKNAVVKRYERFAHFNDRPSAKEKDKEKGAAEPGEPPIDLDALMKKWVVPGGFTHQIAAEKWHTQEGKSQFLREIRKFTSSREPLHYLVNKLTLYAPIPILRDHIELIDTPGLDDTEKFRVVLTENLVKDVDAILFLTVSGASYSDSDKEFLVRQLRQRQIKHLQIIVTKSDETYANACRDAEEEGENPPSFAEFREKEIARVRREVRATLDELLASQQLGDDAGYYFIEQLDSVPIHLISAKFQDEGDEEKAGIRAVTDSLYHVLSHSNRFEQSRSILCNQLERTLEQLKRSFAERLDTVESEFDPAKVQQQIEAIRQSLAAQLVGFEERAGEWLRLLQNEQEAMHKALPLHLDLMAGQAKEVLSDLEKDDLAKHWKGRRYGGWGHLQDLQSRIADRVFPRVEVILNELLAHLDSFMDAASTRLIVLQSEIETIESQHRMTGLESLSLSELQAPRLQKLRGDFAMRAQQERDAIVSNLDDFISAEIQERLDDARTIVQEIRGTGTVIRQAEAVSGFYSDVRRLLTEALRSHLRQRITDFGAEIVLKAQSVAPQIRETSETAIDQRLKAIQSSLEVAEAGKREEVATYLTDVLGILTNFAADPDTRLTIERKVLVTEAVTGGAPEALEEPLQEVHYEIAEGATGYTYERIFRPYVDHASEIVIEDPYITKRHQVDNLTRFCALAIRLGRARKIELITKDMGDEENQEADAQLEGLRRELQARNVTFNWRRVPTLHDREIRFDNGWTIKVGRGLDIYHKPETWTSMSATDFTLRPCKHTKVDVFRMLG